MKATTIVDIHAELERARIEFPMPNPTFVALCEEVGELAQALLKCKSYADSRRVYEEAKQVAVMAIRMMEEGDQNYIAYTPELLDTGLVP